MHNLDTNADRIIFQFLASPEQAPLILVAGNVWAQTCPDQSKSTKDLLLNMSDSQNTFYSPETELALWILTTEIGICRYILIYSKRSLQTSRSDNNMHVSSESGVEKFSSSMSYTFISSSRNSRYFLFKFCKSTFLILQPIQRQGRHVINNKKATFELLNFQSYNV